MPALARISADQICRFDRPASVLEPQQRDGNVSLLELLILNHIAEQKAPAIVFEFGTFDGRTTLNFAANTPDSTRIYTIDLPRSQLDQTYMELDQYERKYADKDSPGVRFQDTPEAAKIVQLLGDTANFDFSPWYGNVDLVFIDASHTAAYVQNDTEIALKLIGSRPGIIIWHNYGIWPDVTDVLDGRQESDPRLRDTVHIFGTSIALCEPNSKESPAGRARGPEIEVALATDYWLRYPDVAADGTYGEHGQLGIYGARLHFEIAGRSEGRTWRPSPNPLIVNVKPTSMERSQAQELVQSFKNWHHRFEIYPDVITPGTYSPDYVLQKLNLPDSLKGLRALDIGASDGFYSRELYRRGAEVTSFDYRSKTSNGFSIMERLSDIELRHVHGNIINIDSLLENETFDLILFLGVIYHLPDPIMALWKLRGLLRGEMFLETYCEDIMGDDQCVARYYVGDTLVGDVTNFWAPSSQCVFAWLKDTGFDAIEWKRDGDRFLVRCEPNRAPNWDRKMRTAYGLIRSDRDL